MYVKHKIYKLNYTIVSLLALSEALTNVNYII